jgi:hypothetical protein
MALGGIGLIVIVLVVGYQMILNRAFNNGCGNEILAQSVSPDGSKKFVVFQRSCGATTGFSTQASLISADATLADEPGNVFVADTDHGVAPSGTGGGPELRSHWAAPDHLVLQHHMAARVFKAEQRFKNVEIKYETFR